MRVFVCACVCARACTFVCVRVSVCKFASVSCALQYRSYSPQTRRDGHIKMVKEMIKDGLDINHKDNKVSEI